jgi:cytochrome oxidase assembly protein ShyY1
VVTPFRTDSGATYFVNRGWIAAPLRGALPDASTPPGSVRIEVVPWPSTGLGVLAGADDWNDGWPKRVQRMDIERMATYVRVALPMELRLEAASPGVLQPVAATLDLSPSRHLGYAVQWFALALALAATWLVIGIRRGRAAGSRS